MNNKSMIWGVVALVVILGGGYFLYHKSNNGGAGGENNPNAYGRVVFSVTDAAADMGAVSEVTMNVSKVDMHSQTSGWATVSTSPRTYNLLALNASQKSMVLADISTRPGTYDQVRVTIDSVTIKGKDGSTKTAKVPASELALSTKVVVVTNMIASVNFDFMADKSLYTTSKGEYIFAPVVKTEVKSKSVVGVGSDGVVSIIGGNVDSSNTSGMDIDGSVNLDFQLDPERDYGITSSNAIIIEGLLK